jgi:hypothetical protein
MRSTMCILKLMKIYPKNAKNIRFINSFFQIIIKKTSVYGNYKQRFNQDTDLQVRGHISVILTTRLSSSLMSRSVLIH